MFERLALPRFEDNRIVTDGKVPEEDTERREETLLGGNVEVLVCVSSVEQGVCVEGYVGKTLCPKG